VIDTDLDVAATHQGHRDAVLVVQRLGIRIAGDRHRSGGEVAGRRRQAGQGQLVEARAVWRELADVAAHLRCTGQGAVFRCLQLDRGGKVQSQYLVVRGRRPVVVDGQGQSQRIGTGRVDRIRTGGQFHLDVVLDQDGVTVAILVVVRVPLDGRIKDVRTGRV